MRLGGKCEIFKKCALVFAQRILDIFMVFDKCPLFSILFVSLRAPRKQAQKRQETASTKDIERRKKRGERVCPSCPATQTRFACSFFFHQRPNE